MLTDTVPTFSLPGAPYLEYLPVVDLSSGRLLGMEALVRWEHPSKGRISPEELIPEAERSGDIAALTQWVLREACDQARRWSPSIQLAVNCTVQQLRRGEVSNAVESALQESGLRSGQLTLEVTEDAVVEPDAASDLRTLSEMGVQLSIDDVGTNWSSFEPFQRHAIGTVKIDGSFVSGLELAQGINRLVVETVIHMAHSLGMSAVVECVETTDQVETVRKFDADAAQGFFFAHPMRAEHAEALASGPDIPRFSLTEIRTLLLSDDRVLELDEFILGPESAQPEVKRGAEEDGEPEGRVAEAEKSTPDAEEAAAEETAAETEVEEADAETVAAEAKANRKPSTPRAKSTARTRKAATDTEKSAAPRSRSRSTARGGSGSSTRKPRRTTRRT
ncbi:MAG: EAL domain-containing protein [Acidimicrobiales bacterium]